MALQRLTSFTFGTGFLTLVYGSTQTFNVSYAHLIGFESDPRSGDLTIWIYTAGEVSETLSVRNSDLVAIGSSTSAFVALMNQNIQPYSYWEEFLASTTANGALPTEPSALRGQCLYAHFQPLYNSGSPSLINVPARFKAGTLYSQIPESGAGDFTVTRTTTVANRSTRINKNGLIELVNDNVPRLDYPLGGAVNGCPALLVEPSAANGILNSNNTTTGWTHGINLSSGAIDVIGVSGINISVLAIGFITQTASRYISSNNNVSLASGSTYTFSFLMKKTGAHTIGGYRFGMSSGAIGSGFDVSGSFASGSNTSTAPITNRIRRIEQYGTDVYRCSETFTMTAPAIAQNVAFAPLSGVTLTSTAVGGSMGFAAPQLELGSVPTSFIPTTTAAVTRSADVISKTSASALIGQSEGTIYAEFVNTLIASYSEAYLYRIFADANNEIWARKEAGGNTYSFRWRANSQNTTFLNVVVPNGANKIAFGYKSGDTALFLNGSQVGTTSTDVRAFANNPTTIAIGSTSSGQFFNDRIRAASLYTTRLTDAQLQALTAP